jgi:AmmeMemoRadiSam system protein A
MGAASPSPVHPYVKLATDTIDAYVRDFRVITPPDGLFERHPALWGRVGVFVSLKMRGELRGCIGTIEPAHENLALEIIENAISAATKDPRFRPVVEAELPELVVSVDILTTPERVAGHEDLDVRRYGLIVKAGTRRGLLLPDIEGIDSVDEQMAVARKKGGIGEQEPVELYRFTVERYV